jgi:hypothetical protein
MGDQYGQRQQRTWAASNAESRDPMSPEHRQIEAERRARQAAAAQDPYLNGRDSLRRLHGDQ